MAKVLILESDRLIAYNLSRYLNKRSHKVVWSADPQIAIEEIDSSKPDLIVMDLMLGGHNGVEFLFELRSYPEWFNIPVILYSSLQADEILSSQSELDQLGLAGFFYKPKTSLSEVNEAIDRLTTKVAT